MTPSSSRSRFRPPSMARPLLYGTAERATSTTLSSTERATSTTLDVTLCLLLVSAAVGVLATTGPPADDHDVATADRVADRLATTTVTVTYRPAPRGSGDPTADAVAEGTDSDGTPRTVHGTPATLLARAAVADLRARPGGTGPGPSSVRRLAPRPPGSYGHAVRNHTRDTIADVGAAVNVTARYAPLADPAVTKETEFAGAVAVGPTPPAAVDVSVVRVSVPVGTSAIATDAALERAADSGGFEALSAVLADGTLDSLLPPPRTRWGVRDDGTRALVAARYRALAESLGGDVARAVGVDETNSPSVGVTRDALATALAARYEEALRARYDSPAAAANATDPTVVTLTIRTWSR